MPFTFDKQVLLMETLLNIWRCGTTLSLTSTLTLTHKYPIVCPDPHPKSQTLTRRVKCCPHVLPAHLLLSLPPRELADGAS